jgi:hypothetical protein
MHEMILLIALAVSIFGNLFFITRNLDMRNAIQAAVDKAEIEHREFIRIPFNQALSWGFSARHGIFRDPKEFNRKPGGPHPATLSAANRRSLP